MNLFDDSPTAPCGRHRAFGETRDINSSGDRPLFENLPKALKELREQAGLIQDEAARSSGVSRTLLSEYERGRKAPGLENLGKLLKAYDASLYDLEVELARAGGSTAAVERKIGDLEQRIRALERKPAGH